MYNLTEDAKAILLLCGRFGKNGDTAAAKPLNLTEYNRLADWMINEELRPADLLGDVLEDTGLQMGGIDRARIQKLLLRGAALALALEKWDRNGVWVVCRSDEAYPDRLKTHLKRTQAPPILFGVGDIRLLSQGGLAVVGSRNVDGSGEAYTRKIGETCARDEMTIVSGGARGVDQFAMLSALDVGGSVIAVMADGLFRAAVARKYRDGIRERRLVLVSPYHPEARFMVGNAMGRNKLIYALANYALIVSAEKGRGGTWAGATEELRRSEARPVFVRLEGDVPDGNRELIQLGARPFPESPWINDLRGLLVDASESEGKVVPTQGSLFHGTETEAITGAAVKEDQKAFEKSKGKGKEEKVPLIKEWQQSIYDVVLPVLLGAIQDWRDSGQLTEELKIQKNQLDDWIKRALQEGVVEKKGWRKLIIDVSRVKDIQGPVQGSLFDEPGTSAKTRGPVKKDETTLEESGASEGKRKSEAASTKRQGRTIYDAVLPILLGRMNEWKNPKELIQELGIRKGQFYDWIKRAIENDLVEKKTRPVRYRKKQ